MKEILVKKVERCNGTVRSVIISAWPWEISFGKINKRVVKLTVKRYDKDRISSPTDLKIPLEVFKPSVNIARGIFSKKNITD